MIFQSMSANTLVLRKVLLVKLGSPQLTVITSCSEILALTLCTIQLAFVIWGFVTDLVVVWYCDLSPSQNQQILLTKVGIVTALGLIACHLAAEEKHVHTFSVMVQRVFSGFAV